MPRHGSILWQVVPRLLALAVVVVIDFPLRLSLSARHAPTTVVGSVDHRLGDDAFQVGQRLEPRVFPAPRLDRISPLSRSSRSDARLGADAAMLPGSVASDRRVDDNGHPIVKHVPRMERGDPPRV